LQGGAPGSTPSTGTDSEGVDSEKPLLSNKGKNSGRKILKKKKVWNVYGMNLFYRFLL
jgi:hypothetical protein